MTTLTDQELATKIEAGHRSFIALIIDALTRDGEQPVLQGIFEKMTDASLVVLIDEHWMRNPDGHKELLDQIPEAIRVAGYGSAQLATAEMAHIVCSFEQGVDVKKLTDLVTRHIETTYDSQEEVVTNHPVVLAAFGRLGHAALV